MKVPSPATPATCRRLNGVAFCRKEVPKSVMALGERVQKSVFECMLAPEELDGALARLQREIGDTPGNVRIYRLCGSCLEASFGIGEIKTRSMNRTA